MRPSRLATSRGLAVWLYLGGLALLLASWAFANPPGDAPDEPSHYVRALGAAAWDIAGDAVSIPLAGATAAQLQNYNDYARKYPVPAGLAPDALACNAFKPTVSAACLNTIATPPGASEQVSFHAGQPPLPYLLAGPAMVHQSNPERAIWAGRSALALWCLLLLAVPLAMAGRFRGRLLLGLTVGLTPMAIFTGSILNPSGLETFSSVGFFLSVIAVAEGRYPRGALAAAAFTGVFVAMSRPFAPLWLIVGLVGAVGLVGPGVFWQAVRRHPWGSALTTALIGLGALSTLFFLELYQSPVPTATATFTGAELRVIGNEAVGDFGWVDTQLPLHVANHWLQVLGVVALLALIFGNWWERLALLLTTALSVGATYVISVKYLLPVDVGPQGRHFLPVLIIPPMVAVIILARQRPVVRLIAVGIPALLMVVLHLIGWIANGARQGLGSPAINLSSIPARAHQLFGTTAWSPPGGFLAWFVVLVLGCLLIAAASVQALLISAVAGTTAPPSRDDLVGEVLDSANTTTAETGSGPFSGSQGRL